VADQRRYGFAAMTDATNAERNVATVQRFLDAFTGGWPTEDEMDELLAPDVRFIVRPNLSDPTGSDRDAAATRAGLQAGKALLAWQRYEVRDHLTSGDTDVSRFHWSGELAIDAGPWARGTKLSAWCVAHYRFEDGKIAEIEQHDCYAAPEPPAG
jgi:ketosteroid isomerase-like protein